MASSPRFFFVFAALLGLLAAVAVDATTDSAADVHGAFEVDRAPMSSGEAEVAPAPANRPLVFPLRLKPGSGNVSRSLLGSATLPLHGSVQEHGYYYAVRRCRLTSALNPR